MHGPEHFQRRATAAEGLLSEGWEAAAWVNSATWVNAVCAMPERRQLLDRWTTAAPVLGRFGKLAPADRGRRQTRRLYVTLLLASTSAARRALLDALGIAYAVEAPQVTEEVPPGTTPEEAVRMLALRKARAVAARRPEAVVLGTDQLAEVEGQVLGKPEDREAARRQLRGLLGREHHLLTAVALVGGGQEALEVDRVRLRLFTLGEGELERYLDTGEWQGCAGGYRIEGRGQALISELEGDRTSVQGLPMLRVVRMLRARGVALL
jgi:septum formation protein